MAQVEISVNNLYADGQIYEIENRQILLRNKKKFTTSILDKWHTVRNTDRLDTLAYQYYRYELADASKYWWAIADVNNIIHPLDLSEYVGKKILIPHASKIQL
jgi:hypothetical protein